MPQLVVKHAPASLAKGDGKEVVTFVILIFVFFGAEKCIVIFVEAPPVDALMYYSGTLSSLPTLHC